MFVEYLSDIASEMGLPKEVAEGLAKQTALGAAHMLLKSKDTPAELRKQVTSPNGTTHAAITSFEQSGFRRVVEKALAAATDRSKQLGAQQ